MSTSAADTQHALERASFLIDEIERIKSVASGRPLTGAQDRDITRHRAELLGMYREAGYGDVVDRALSYGNSADEIVAEVESARHLDRRTESAAQYRDSIGAHIARGPERTGEPADGFDLVRSFQRAQNGEHVVADVAYDTRALASSGGSAIPSTFVGKVVAYQRNLTPMFDGNIVSLISSRDGAPLIFPRLTADPSVGSTVTAEAAQITEADPTLSSVQLDAYKYTSITLWSAELDQDNVIAIENVIAKSAGRAIAIGAGAHCTTGDGSGKPNGFINAGTNGGTANGTAVTGGDTFFGWPDLVDLYGSLAAPYSANGTWMVSPTAFTKILKFRDTTGNPVFNPGLAGAPGSLMGRPLVINPAMAAVASASKSVAFGDFSAYHVRRVSPVRVEISRDYKFNTDQLALKVVDRLDGDLVDTGAIAYLVSANT